MAPLFRFPITAVIVAVVALSAATTATARPCRTFLISSYSMRNPSTNTFATITEIRSLTATSTNNNPFFFNIPYDQSGAVFPFSHQRNHNHPDLQSASLPRAPLGFYGYDFTSLRDRTKDILSVVLALLFGFGCGSLAAATMYLLWSVFSGRRRDYRYDDLSNGFSDEDGGAEIESPKKFGYVKVPAAEAAKDSSSV